MNALYERSMLGAIECHELFGEHDRARKLTKEYNSEKKKSQKENKDKLIKKSHLKKIIGTLDNLGNLIVPAV